MAENVSGSGRRALVGVLKGYLDENGTHQGAALTCAAGYLFTREGADAFADGWAPFLASKELKFCRASECACRDDFEEIFSTLTDLIKSTSLAGVVRFILPDDSASLREDVRVQHFTGSSYSLCILSCMEHMAQIAGKSGDTILYFIERGNEFAGEVRHFLNQIKDTPELMERFAMEGAHTYDKKDVIQLQAADCLAWEFGRAYTHPHWIEPLKRLCEERHYISGFSDISAVVQGMVNSFYGLKSNRKKF
jgi:hypothetical protein